MWIFSVLLCPAGIGLFICGAVIQPYEGMTPEIRTFLYIVGCVFICCSLSINATLKYFFPVDTDDLRVVVKRTMNERKALGRKKEKQRNLKSALQISIPGFEDVKIRPKLEDISDSDGDDSDDEGEIDPESRW